MIRLKTEDGITVRGQDWLGRDSEILIGVYSVLYSICSTKTNKTVTKTSLRHSMCDSDLLAVSHCQPLESENIIRLALNEGGLTTTFYGGSH